MRPVGDGRFLPKGIEHCVPVWVEGHWQSKVSSLLIHVPPFWQGADKQWFDDNRQSGGSNPAGQVQLTVAFDTTQVPPFAHVTLAQGSTNTSQLLPM